MDRSCEHPWLAITRRFACSTCSGPKTLRSCFAVCCGGCRECKQQRPSRNIPAVAAFRPAAVVWTFAAVPSAAVSGIPRCHLMPFSARCRRYWWRAQGLAYILRPNAATMAAVRALRHDAAMQEVSTRHPAAARELGCCSVAGQHAVSPHIAQLRHEQPPARRSSASLNRVCILHSVGLATGRRLCCSNKATLWPVPNRLHCERVGSCRRRGYTEPMSRGCARGSCIGDVTSAACRTLA